MSYDNVRRARRRDPFLEVCERGRAFVASVAADEELGARDLRVALAVVDLTALHSWGSDTIAARQLAAIVYGIPANDVEEWQRKKVGVSLRKLAGRGHLTLASGRGRSSAVTITLPEMGADADPDTTMNGSHDSTRSDIHNGAHGRSPWLDEMGPANALNGARHHVENPLNGTPGGAHTELVLPSTSETRASARMRELRDGLRDRKATTA